jgi:ArsR family transcriptional regulator
VVSKHLQVLEEAGLVVKWHREGSIRVELRPEARHVEDWVSFYRGFWTDRLGTPTDIVGSEEEKGR